MTQKIIQHSLRDIVLSYDESIDEKEYERKLLQSYLELHDITEILHKRFAKLYYDYKVSEDILAETSKVIVPIEEMVNKHHKEVERLIKEELYEKTDPVIENYKLQLHNHDQKEIAFFHINLAKPMHAELERLDEEYADFEEADIKLFEEFGATYST